MTAWWALVIGPTIASAAYLAWEFYRAPLRDFIDVRAAERETLIDRIAREELAPFFSEWSERVES